MKKTLLGVMTALVLLGAAPRAEAKLFEFWGSGLMGYAWGQGNSEKDFYRWVRGGAVGAEVGIKILFIGAFVDYLRFFGGDSGANLLSFNLGGDYALDFGKTFSLVFRLAFAYYLGGLPDNATYTIPGTSISAQNVETRGIGVHGGLGPRFNFLKVLSVGVTPEVGYHYFFGGADQSIIDGNSQGFDFSILAYLRVGLGF